jgi:tetratricopeptide (TPR) repeat protein
VVSELYALFLARGDREQAERQLSLAAELTDSNEVQERAQLLALRAQSELADGRRQEALEAAEAAVATRAELTIANHFVGAAIVTGLEAAFALGADSKIDDLLGIIEALPPGSLTPSLRATGARFSARRAALRNDNETAEAGYTAAAEIFREVERPFNVAVVSLEHAEWLVGEGRADEAKPLLEEARTIFERLRAAPWLERVAAVGAPAAALRS